jgi:DNA-binding PadR family transcriptional regulator
MTKPVRSFRISAEGVRQLRELSEDMGRSESEVIEVAVDRMYREEIRFGNLSVAEKTKPEDNYQVDLEEGK